jgi:hypothetical protein
MERTEGARVKRIPRLRESKCDQGNLGSRDEPEAKLQMPALTTKQSFAENWHSQSPTLGKEELNIDSEQRDPYFVCLPS